MTTKQVTKFFNRLFPPSWFGDDDILLHHQLKPLDPSNPKSKKKPVYPPKQLDFTEIAPQEDGTHHFFNAWLPTKGCFVYMDVDNISELEVLENELLPRFALKPSIIVSSGSGFHLYWLLDKPQKLPPVESGKKYDIASIRLARIIQTFGKNFGGDNVADPARLLRIPNTINPKNNNPCTIIKNTSVRYSIKELEIIAKIKTAKLTGMVQNTTGKKNDRSDHEFATAKALFKAGLTQGQIEVIFVSPNFAVGEKVAERGGLNGEYWRNTIAAVLESKEADKSRTKPSKGGDGNNAPQGDGTPQVNTTVIFVRDNAYHTVIDDDEIEIANFWINPTRATLDPDDPAKNLFHCEIIADGGEHVTNMDILASYFSTYSRFASTVLADLYTVWLGGSNQNTVSAIFNHIKMTAKDNGVIPETPLKTIGLNPVNGMAYSSTQAGQALTANGLVDDPKNIFSMQKRLRIDTSFDDTPLSPNDLRVFWSLINDINDPAVIYPIINWLMACFVKPRFGGGFPLCNLYGVHGSGKTATVKDILQPLAGYDHEHIMGATSVTPYIVQTKLGHSMTIPLFIGEFNPNTARQAKRYPDLLKTCYDGATSEQGTPNGTAISHLHAPVCIDGEAILIDPALQERIVPIHFDPQTTRQKKAKIAFNKLARMYRDGLLKRIGTHFQMFALAYQEKIVPLLDAHLDTFNERIEGDVNNRIVRSHAILAVGAELLRDFTISHCGDDCGLIDPHTTEYLQTYVIPLINNVVMADGLVDEPVIDFLSFVASAVELAKTRGQNAGFQYILTARKSKKDGGNVHHRIWFDFGRAYDAWIRQNYNIGGRTDKKVIASQLHSRSKHWGRAVLCQKADSNKKKGWQVNLTRLNDIVGGEIPAYISGLAKD